MKLKGKVSGRKEELDAARRLIKTYDAGMSQARSRAR
jgi:hypothetical protein